MFSSDATRPTALQSIGIEEVSPDLTGICPRRAGDGVAVGVCALGVVLGVVAHGVKVVRVVGDGVAVVVRPDVVRGRGCPWVRSCSDQGEGVPISQA